LFEGEPEDEEELPNTKLFAWLDEQSFKTLLERANNSYKLWCNLEDKYHEMITI
jgi:hypothetical protein